MWVVRVAALYIQCMQHRRAHLVPSLLVYAVDTGG
jgi:hypothetical protein